MWKKWTGTMTRHARHRPMQPACECTGRLNETWSIAVWPIPRRQYQAGSTSCRDGVCMADTPILIHQRPISTPVCWVVSRAFCPLIQSSVVTHASQMLFFPPAICCLRSHDAQSARAYLIKSYLACRIWRLRRRTAPHINDVLEQWTNRLSRTWRTAV